MGSLTSAGDIASIDLRISECAPDRMAATSAWAAGRLREHEQLLAKHARAMLELAAAEREHLIERRVEAIKRGEIYIAPAPPMPEYRSASIYPAASMGYAGATMCL